MLSCPPPSASLHPSLLIPLILSKSANHSHKLLAFPAVAPIKQQHNPSGRSSCKKLWAQKLVATQEADNAENFLTKGDVQTVSDFNRLLTSLVTADEFELALELNSKISSFGLVPDHRTYSILVNCYCKKNEPIEARNILHLMLEKGFEPNAPTFTTLINLFCQKGRIGDAFQVFEVMSKIGCEPTINTYNCLLKGFCYVGRVEEAFDLLLNIKKSSIVKPDIYTYSALMDGFCKVGRSDEALELLDEALEMELTPNVVTYNTLFNGYFKEGRPLCGLGLLNLMKEQNCRPDCISYSTLLHGLLKWGKVRAALQIYREMVGIGFQVDERMMNTLLRGLCRSSRKERELLRDVYDVFEEMRNGKYTIYPDAYNLLVEAFCNGSATEITRAFGILNEMMEIGFSPRTFTFNVVMRRLCFIGEINRAMTVLTLVHKDRNPTSIPFSFLISELNQQGRLLHARNVYGMALKRGVVPKRKPG